MEREKGITNDGVHCEMKEDMRAFRQRAGSDASLEEWVKQSVWARGTGVDLERAMGATTPLCTPATRLPALQRSIALRSLRDL